MNRFFFLAFTLLISLVTFAGPMNGDYTVGPSSSTGGKHYQTFSEAVNALVINSIDGNVTFTLEDHSYDEQKSIPFFARANSTDTVFFRSSNNLVGGVKLASSVSSSSANYILQVDSSSLLFFQGIQFETQGSTYAGVVKLNSGTHNIHFNNCNFVAPKITSDGGGNKSLVYCPTSARLENIHFFECEFIGGDDVLNFNMYPTRNSRNQNIGHCKFKDYYGGAIVFSNLKGTKIINNNFETPNNPACGILLTGVDSTSEITGNFVNGGMYALNLTNNSGGIAKMNIFNNKFKVGDANAVNIVNSDDFNFQHNTVYNNASTAFTVRVNNSYNFNIQNNIFFNENSGTPLEFKTAGLNPVLSNNCYYSISSEKVAADAGSISDFNAWFLSDGFGNNAYVVNPNFRDVNTLELSCSSPTGLKSTINIAGITQDFDGDERDGINPWIGADEMTASGTDQIMCQGIVHDGTDTLRDGKVYFIGKANDNKKLLDTIAETDIVDGVYQFTNVNGYPFYLIIDPDRTLHPNYLKCYSNQEKSWENVELKKAPSCNYTWDIKPLQLAAVATGTNTIEGTVNLESTGKTTNPIPGLDVVLDKIPPSQSVATTVTDENGAYTFANLPEGNYEVIIDYPGIGLDTLHEVEITIPGTTVSQVDYCVDTTSTISAGCADVNSIVENQFDVLNIYPNPVDNELTLSIPVGIKGEVFIYSLQGKLVLKQNDLAPGNTVDVSNLKVGYYTIKVRSDKSNLSGRFIKK